MLLEKGFEDEVLPVSLQEAFKKFRKKKKKSINESKLNAQFIQRGFDEKQNLRELFLNQARKYIGVPYAQKHHKPSSYIYHSEIFLDCCGLVRQVLKDLNKEFSFEIGPWNQSYQFDILPISLKKEEMKRGDLVFISGVYYNEKSKVYPHNMVHVEIWLGEGEKTIGARWKTGKVEIHDSYMFTAKSYHSMIYHFKSIDTWLDGVCRSHCKEHSWKTSNCDYDKYSIFASDNEDNGESEKGENVGKSNCMLPLETNQSPASIQQNEGKKDGESKKKSLCSSDSKEELSDKKPSEKLKIDSSTKKKNLKETKRTFYIGGNNGVALVEKPLLDLGMERTSDDKQFFLKWVEIKKRINFTLFRSGEQIVNHIPSINCLTTKTGLLQTLREYERLTNRSGLNPGKSSQPFLISNCFMETYFLNSEKSKFLETYKEGEIWIVKPSSKNQGKGIYLINDAKQLEVKQSKQTSTISCNNDGGIIQRYIMNPLLINGYKFDIRAYMLIASTQPHLVYYHKGYARLSCVKYSNETLDLQAHLTNQYVQKKHPSYSEKKEETVLNFDQLNQYINDNEKDKKHLVEDWIYQVYTPAMKEIMLSCFLASKRKLEQNQGMFELLGFDFMIDENMKVWLIEVNINPALHTNCSVLKEVIPPIVAETLDVVVEIHEKQKNHLKLHRLKNIHNFETLYNAVTGYSYKRIVKKKESIGRSTESVQET